MSLNQNAADFVKPMIPIAFAFGVLVMLIIYFSINFMIKNRIEQQYLATFSGNVKWTGMKRDAHGKKRWAFSVEDSVGTVVTFSECVDPYLATRLNIGDKLVKTSEGSSAIINNEVVNLFDCKK